MERYNPYRGKRRQGSRVLKVIVVVLAVVLAACLIFTVTLGRYVQYTDDGVRLDLPWGREEPGPGPSLEMIIED